MNIKIKVRYSLQLLACLCWMLSSSHLNLLDTHRQGGTHIHHSQALVLRRVSNLMCCVCQIEIDIEPDAMVSRTPSPSTYTHPLAQLELI